MSIQISLREANQHLSQYIDLVEKGEEVIITRQGQPIVKIVIVPIKKTLTTAQKNAWDRMLKKMQKGYNLGGNPFCRNDLYKR